MGILERVLVTDHETTNCKSARSSFCEKMTSYQVSTFNSKKKNLLMIRKTKLIFVCLCLVVVFGLYQLTTSRFTLKDYFSGTSWSDEACTPQTSIVFLKTHKTAGSTVQNIFLRYADTHDLLVAISEKTNYLGHPAPFRRTFVPPLKPGYSYDILCHHARFNYKQLLSLMGNNATFVTIIRDPADMFESLFTYYKLEKRFNATLEELAMSHFQDTDRMQFKFGRNQMIFDLGLSEELFDDDEFVTDYIRSLDKAFHLVMIAERMKESLVLLRHLLCWEVEDVLMFEHNVRLPVNKKPFDPLIEDGLRELNRADQMLYEYFDQRLTERIDQFGVKRMKREVRHFETDLNSWYQFCVERKMTKKNLGQKFKPYSGQVYGFKLRENISNPMCENMAKAELPYTAELRKKQKAYYRYEDDSDEWS